MLKELVKEDDDDMENYDPQAQLSDIKRQHSKNDGASIAQSRDTWKMNYKMKNNALKKD